MKQRLELYTEEELDQRVASDPTVQNIQARAETIQRKLIEIDGRLSHLRLVHEETKQGVSIARSELVKAYTEQHKAKGAIRSELSRLKKEKRELNRLNNRVQNRRKVHQNRLIKQRTKDLYKEASRYSPKRRRMFTPAYDQIQHINEHHKIESIRPVSSGDTDASRLEADPPQDAQS